MENLDKSPLPGLDVAKLDDAKQTVFYTLMASLESPCGKPHSLRVSVATDQSCKRAPFAAKLVASILEDGGTEKVVREMYTQRYKTQATPAKFTSEGPRVGAPDAPIQIVEFFDYGCPACVHFKPELEKLIAERGKDIAVSYKMYPLLAAHPDSGSAAQAALAAHAQGKFAEMHTMLFAKGKHKRDDVMGYAKEIGLDMAKFEADYAAADPKVKADAAEGDAAKIHGTPSLFINGVAYEGPRLAKYLGMVVDEELAVMR